MNLFCPKCHHECNCEPDATGAATCEACHESFVVPVPVPVIAQTDALTPNPMPGIFAAPIMPLQVCPECGAEVPMESGECPHCGNK